MQCVKCKTVGAVTRYDMRAGACGVYLSPVCEACYLCDLAEIRAEFKRFGLGAAPRAPKWASFPQCGAPADREE